MPGMRDANGWYRFSSISLAPSAACCLAPRSRSAASRSNRMKCPRRCNSAASRNRLSTHAPVASARSIPSLARNPAPTSMVRHLPCAQGQPIARSNSTCCGKPDRRVTLQWGSLLLSCGHRMHRLSSTIADAWITYKIACNVIPTQAQAQQQGLLGSILSGVSNVIGLHRRLRHHIKLRIILDLPARRGLSTPSAAASQPSAASLEL